MTDLDRRIVEAGAALLSVEVAPPETERALRQLKAVQRRRERRVLVAGGLATVAAVAALVVWTASWRSDEPIVEAIAAEDAIVPPAEPGPEHDETKRVIYFSDGSHAVLVRPRTELRMEAVSPDLLELTIAAGEARFEVVPSKKRLFRVRTGDLRVEVLGTSFTVKEEDGRSRVDVHQGRVAVYRGKNRHELGADMTFLYDGERVVVEDRAAPVDDDEVERPRKERRRRRARRATRRRSRTRATRSWKSLARKGDLRAAYEVMRTPETGDIRDETQDLMLAADVARLTGHPWEAVGYLERVVDRHQSHPRALVAAFTLGRILHRELEEPRRAAAAFRTAYALAPTGSLAEDALAHEIECLVQSGELEAARARAETYLRLFPEGRKLKSVKRWSGAP